MGVIDSIGKAGPLSLRRSVVALADLKAPCGAKGDLDLLISCPHVPSAKSTALYH